MVLKKDVLAYLNKNTVTVTLRDKFQFYSREWQSMVEYGRVQPSMTKTLCLPYLWQFSCVSDTMCNVYLDIGDPLRE